MDKKDKIIEAALKLFVENGFHGTATAKIAQKAGVANGTLFNYFKTKDELIISLYNSIKEEMAAHIAQKTNKDKGLKEAIKIQFSEALWWALDNPMKFRFIQQFQTSPYQGNIELQAIESQVMPHLMLIEKGIELKELKALPSDLVFTLVSSQTFGLYQYLTSKKLTRNKQQETIQQTFELLWDMIKLNKK